MNRPHRSRGFSLVELLTVVAIIGVMSLVGVPAFINYQKSMTFKTSMRQLTSDLRGARQRAATRSTFVMVGNMRNEGAVGDTRGVYEILESTDRGTTYTLLQTRQLEKRSEFGAVDDIVFRPNGTVILPGGSYSTTVELQSLDNIPKPEFAVTVAVTGKVAAN